MEKKFIYRVITFYLIAIIISNLFRFDVFDLKPGTLPIEPSASILLIVILEGIGVLIGALIAIGLMKKVRTSSMSLFGTSRTKSIVIFVLPIVVLTVIGVNNEYQLNSNFYGFIAGLATFIYCILEEYGWRGYLQDELSELKSWKRYLIIGFLWYLWHLSFLSNTNVIDNLIFLSMLVIGSWGIGQIAIATKSVIACATFHFLVNIFTVNQLIKNGFQGNSRWLAIGIILTIVTIIIKKWPKSQNVLRATTYGNNG